MVRFIVGIILCFITFEIYAQQRVSREPSQTQTIEDFKSSISTITNQDSLVSLYYQYALQSFRTNPRILPEIADLVLQLDEVDKDRRQAFHNLILSRYWERPRPDSAIIFAERSMDYFQNVNDEEQIISLKIALSNLYTRNNEFIKAEEELLAAADLLKETQIKSFQENFIIERLANLYMRVGATEIAIAQYEQLLDTETDITSRCNTYLRISNAYRTNNEIEKAKAILLECEDSDNLALSRKVSIKKSLGTLEKLQGNLSAAIDKFEDAVELEKNSPRKDFTTYLFLAQSYNEIDELEKVESVIEIMEGFDLNRLQLPARVQFYILKASTFFAKKDNLNALSMIDNAIDLASRMQPNLLTIDAYQLKGKILESMGKFKEAYELIVQVIDQKAIIEKRAEEIENSITKVRFQIRAKNQEIDNAYSELDTVKTRNVLIIIVLIFLTMYVIYRYRIYYLLKEERTRNKIARDLHDDLSATLSSISFFSEAAKREYAYLEKPGKFLRRIDESAIEAKEKINDIIWAIEPENDDWRTFLTKCKRYAAEMFESKEIDYKIDIDVSIKVPLDIKLRQDIWLIFKEMITNIVRHSKARNAKIHINKDSGNFVMMVSDDGIGIEDPKINSGNGLSNIRFRAEKLKASVTLSTEKEKGTEWKIEFDS